MVSFEDIHLSLLISLFVFAILKPSLLIQRFGLSAIVNPFVDFVSIEEFLQASTFEVLCRVLAPLFQEHTLHQ